MVKMYHSGRKPSIMKVADRAGPRVSVFVGDCIPSDRQSGSHSHCLWVTVHPSGK